MELKVLQEQFATSLITPAKTIDLEAWIAPHRYLTANAQISIYRHSILERIIKVLRATFPVCFALVGETCFRGIGRTLIETYSSHFPDVDFFSNRFSTFLKTFKPIQQLTYLSDVAQLEWACQRHDIDFSTYLCLSTLSQVEEAHYGALNFYLPRGATLIASDFPILQIWQVNQEGFKGEQTVSLDEGGCQLLVYRIAGDLRIELLSAAEFSLLTCFRQGMSLETACEKIQTSYPEEDFPLLFKRIIEQHWVIGYGLCDEKA